MKRPVLVIVGLVSGAILVAAAGASAHSALNLARSVGHSSIQTDEASGSPTESPEPSESPEASPTAEPSETPEPTESPTAENDNDQGEDNDEQGDDNDQGESSSSN